MTAKIIGANNDCLEWASQKALDEIDSKLQSLKSTNSNKAIELR